MHLSDVVVAEVKRVKPHPDAEKLSVCTVWDGAAEHQVVCGAPNVRAGLQTAFARIGAALPGGLEITRSKLRGVESNGMLCSAAELGIGDDADGIMELNGDYRPGTSLRDALAARRRQHRHRTDAESRRLPEHSRYRARDRRAVPDATSGKRTVRRSRATVDDTFAVRLEDGQAARAISVASFAA